jgi:hypothetical protein
MFNFEGPTAHYLRCMCLVSRLLVIIRQLTNIRSTGAHYIQITVTLMILGCSAASSLYPPRTREHHPLPIRWPCAVSIVARKR